MEEIKKYLNLEQLSKYDEKIKKVIKSSSNNGNIVVTATSEDGYLYTATVDSITELYAGMEITIIPNTGSYSRNPVFNLNQLGEIPICRRNVNYSGTASSDVAYDFEWDWLRTNFPIKLTLNATCDEWISDVYCSSVTESGTYTGTGDNYVSLYFNRAPKIVFIVSDSSSDGSNDECMGIIFTDMGWGYVIKSNGSHIHSTWISCNFMPEACYIEIDDENFANALDVSGRKYNYVAIG